MVAGGAARADHTKEDAQATTKRLEAILHPPPPKKAKAAPKPKPPAPTVEAQHVETTAAAAGAVAKPAVDPLYAIIVHAMSIPFDEKEREAHLRDIPKNAKELDAHLRRLDAALEAKHQHR
jgi:hypothetical protein